MIYGYARVSTKGQATDGNSLEAQSEELRVAGATEIFSDTYRGTTTDRPELTRLLSVLQDGDTLIVTKLDRIAHTARQGLEIVDRLNGMGVSVRILNMGGAIDGSPLGRLMRTMLFAFAEFERDLIVERTQEGKRIARSRPDFREGKFPTKKELSHAMSLLYWGPDSLSQVAELTGISQSTLISEARRRLVEKAGSLAAIRDGKKEGRRFAEAAKYDDLKAAVDFASSLQLFYNENNCVTFDFMCFGLKDIELREYINWLSVTGCVNFEHEDYKPFPLVDESLQWILGWCDGVMDFWSVNRQR